jgi:hypothetical protein
MSPYLCATRDGRSSGPVRKEQTMFITLLAVTFLIALAVSFVVARLFKDPVERILERLIADEISVAWERYMRFAIFVVGISQGVRVWELERYITQKPMPSGSHRETAMQPVLELTQERWILEVYRTIIETLQGIAWALLLFFSLLFDRLCLRPCFESKKGDRQ